MGTRAAVAALVACGWLWGGALFPAVAAAWSEFGETNESTVADPNAPEIREPFFEFLLGMTRSDSLGSWTGAQLLDYVSRAGRPSRFPLPALVSLSRSRPDSAQAAHYPDVTVAAVWHIVLSGPQDRPMPYSILGYHPGSMRIAARLVFVELALGEVALAPTADDTPATLNVSETVVLALEEGYVLLDADGWLDALLGAGLDDAWTLGFVVGRDQGKLLGLGVSLGREGRHIYGEFDFAADKVLAHGRPLAAALSRYSRTWLTTADGHLPQPWREATDR